MDSSYAMSESGYICALYYCKQFEKMQVQLPSGALDRQVALGSIERSTLPKKWRCLLRGRLSFGFITGYRNQNHSKGAFILPRWQLIGKSAQMTH